MQKRRRKFTRKGVAAESPKRRAGFKGIPLVHTPKMPPIGESQHALVKFERYIHMHAIGQLIGAAEKFTGIAEPD